MKKHCFYCDQEVWGSFTAPDILQLETIDHVIPLSRGGHKSHPLNKVVACYYCNSLKADFLPEEFLKVVLSVRNNCKPLNVRKYMASQVSVLMNRIVQHKHTMTRDGHILPGKTVLYTASRKERRRTKHVEVIVASTPEPITYAKSFEEIWEKMQSDPYINFHY